MKPRTKMGPLYLRSQYGFLETSEEIRGNRTLPATTRSAPARTGAGAVGGAPAKQTAPPAAAAPTALSGSGAPSATPDPAAAGPPAAGDAARPKQGR